MKTMKVTARRSALAMFYRSAGSPSLSLYLGRRGVSFGPVLRKERIPGKYGISFRVLGRVGALLVAPRPKR